MKAKESELAHKYLDGLKGIEIGGGAHNPFNIKDCINVDYTKEMTVFQTRQIKDCGEYLNVDIVANGDELPFEDDSLDYVLSSHVIEHFKNPIKTLKEWIRVVKPGGYIFTICPHKERTIDRNKPRTTLNELIERDLNPSDDFDDHRHWTIWVTEDMVELCNYLGYNVIEYHDKDDKVGNGFTVIIKK